MQNNNNFQISGFIAQDAQIRQFATASVARFPLAIARTEQDAEGKDKRVSALMNIECWRKNEANSDFELLAKGNRVAIEGYFKPEEWSDKDGVKHSRIVMVAKSVSAAEDKNGKENSGKKAE